MAKQKKLEVLDPPEWTDAQFDKAVLAIGTPEPVLVWTELDSSNLEAVAHHEATQTLCVRFKGGGLYTYDGVVHQAYSDLVHAESVGKYLNQVVKVKYPYTKWFSDAEMLAKLNAQ